MKKTMLPVVGFLTIFALLFSCQQHENPLIIHAPGGTMSTKTDKTGKTVIPNGRFIQPYGSSYLVAPHPFGIALSQDNNFVVTANSGINPISMTLLKNITANEPDIKQIPPDAHSDRGVLESVFMGVAISADNAKVYVSGGQTGFLYVFDANTGAKTDSIDCRKTLNDPEPGDAYLGDLTLTRDGSLLFVVDQIQFRMLIIDTKQMQVIKSVKTGRYPFGIALSPDEKMAYVANVGMFEYTPIQFRNPKSSGVEFPTSAFGSEQAQHGYENDSVVVAGLGDPNVAESFSVWTIDVSNPENAVVRNRLKTGHLVGAKVEGIPAVGGSSPNSIVATNNYVFVSNGNNDCITVIDINTDTILTEIFLKPHPAVKNFRGVIPFGLAISPDQRRLYVAEAGINAIGVVDVPTLSVIGHIPTGWFPSKLKVTSDGKKLVIANAKGFGSGPNGGKDYQPGPEGTYIGSLMKGTVQVADIPDDKKLEELTRQVIENNFSISHAGDNEHNWRKNNPVPLYGGSKTTPIKYIVFISKENRTYDEIFGQVKNGNGDSSLARYGTGVSFSNRSKNLKVENATVMPNHLKLAREFAISDNFYVDSDVSADGHRWLVNTYPNEWVETSTAASYGGNRNFKEGSKAPGMYAFNGAAGAIYPEDYNEAGSMWDHLDRHGIDFFNFGFGIMFEPANYHESFKYTGIKHLVNYPVPQPMYSRTSKTYPTYNTSIPDQFRIDQFIREFNEKWIGDSATMPQVLTVIIPNDHGAGERPDAGYPFRESYMADNDLAVGRIVEFLSHTRYWENMAIFITEDDAQNGVDHVDAHRSILMVISPWAKKDYVGHVHYSFGSIFKTFWNILGLPYLNQYDAGATDLADMFSDVPDLSPYSALPSDSRFFDPQKALDPFDEKFDWKALEESPVIDNPTDMMRESKEKDNDRLEDREK